jgi:RNA-binding protein 26
LRTKSYLPYAATSPSPSYPPANPPNVDTGIPIPLDGLLSPSMPTSSDRIRKRSLDHDDRDFRAAAKGARINSEGQFSRYGSNIGSDSRSTGGWAGPGDRHERQALNGHVPLDGMGGMNGSMGMDQPNGRQPQIYRPPDQKRGICRDYYSACLFLYSPALPNNSIPDSGYCARGAFCKFSHGDDAVVPAQMFPMAGSSLPGPLPFMPMFPNGGIPFPMGAAYDPHEARMDMRPPVGGMASGARPQARAPLLSRIQPEDGSRTTAIRASGELPVIQDLTPNPPPDSQAQSDLPEDFSPGNDQTQPPRPITGPMEVDAVMPAAPQMNGNSGFRGGNREGRSRGTFAGENHSFHSDRKDNKTLVVEKIPDDKLSLDAVNDWFKRFGTVTNVAVDASNAKALVSFSKHEEAYAAWKSQEAVFNNRFVKLFWHRPMDGHGQMGARMLAASASLVASISTKDSTPAPPAPPAAPPAQPVTPVKATGEARKASTSTSATSLAAKQRLLEKQISEQKFLMAKHATALPQEKKQIMARLRKLDEEMKTSTGSTTTTIIPPTPKQATPTPRQDDREQKERERLDKELELHSVALAVDGEVEETTENLKAKLERLKAEVRPILDS